MDLPVIKLKNLTYHGRLRTGLYFRYNKALITQTKKLKGVRWHPGERCWHLGFKSTDPKMIVEHFRGMAIIIDELTEKYKPPRFPKKSWQITEDTKRNVSRYARYLDGKRKAKRTIDVYSYLIRDFLGYLSNKPIKEIATRDVELYCEEILAGNKYSINTQRQFISALKHFIRLFPEIRIEEPQLVSPEKQRFLPEVLSPEEVLDILRSTRNIKHRMALAMIYSAGLRISELLNLSLSDIDIDRRQLVVRQSKGRKDRHVFLAKSILPLLANYLTTYRPKVYLIEGASGGRYSAESVRAFLKKSCQRAGISKRVTPHTFRHSFATHLLEDGTDIRHIQELLGHSRPETTMIYTHVKRKDLLNIRSPLDRAVHELIEDTNSDKKVMLSRNL